MLALPIRWKLNVMPLDLTGPPGKFAPYILDEAVTIAVYGRHIEESFSHLLDWFRPLEVLL